LEEKAAVLVVEARDIDRTPDAEVVELAEGRRVEGLAGDEGELGQIGAKIARAGAAALAPDAMRDRAVDARVGADGDVVVDGEAGFLNAVDVDLEAIAARDLSCIHDDDDVIPGRRVAEDAIGGRERRRAA